MAGRLRLPGQGAFCNTPTRAPERPPPKLCLLMRLLLLPLPLAVLLPLLLLPLLWSPRLCCQDCRQPVLLRQDHSSLQFHQTSSKHLASPRADLQQ